MNSKEPAALVQLSIECNRLSRGDLLSKSDPFVVCYDNTTGSPTYLKELGRTETIKNDQNPKFSQKIELKYYFEKLQKLTFKIFDSDDHGHSADELGTVDTAMNEIVGSKGQRLARDISKGGVLIVQAEVMPDQNFDVDFRLSGNHLDKKDFFGSSDPFVVISRNMGGKKTVVHRTEIIKNNLNPAWRAFSLSSASLCGNNFDAKIQFECFDWDADASHDLIGVFETTMNELKTKKKFELINPKKVEKKGYKNSGELSFDNFQISPTPNFVDYLRGGCEVSLMVAIDFTGSNGDPKNPTSLHYRNPTGPNEYMQAIYGVGAVVEPYDYDRMFPVFGFGAKLPGGKVSFDFNCNLNPENPSVYGVPGIIDSYIRALNSVELYGPTNFTPILQKAISIATPSSVEEQKYYVLLMLTDGDISDLEDTIESIIKASHLPLSIIIVGVGANDFETMKILDGDDGRLGIRGQYVARDIVQFVPFRAPGRTPENLAEDVLAEVPKQLVSYFKSKGVKPRVPLLA